MSNCPFSQLRPVSELLHAAFVLFRYGEQIRARSPAAIALAKQLEEAEARRAARLADRQKAGLPVVEQPGRAPKVQ